jgi:SAM-dependent methyltransferase
MVTPVPVKKITEREVRLAYELILGRPPESDDVVGAHVATGRSLRSLGEEFLRSQEFHSKVGATLGIRPAAWPPIDVEVDASPEVLALLFRHVESNWSELGRQEPHWSVLTDDRFKSESLSKNIDSFYNSGKQAVALFEAVTSRCGIDLGLYESAFELGCGVGRVTTSLVTKFRRVCAADVSMPHLKIAADQTRARTGNDRVDWLQLTSPRDLLSVEPFDVFYSIIVLQHNPPPLIDFLLSTILSKIKSGGIAYFQVQTYALGYRFCVAEYLQSTRSDGKMEMHVLPQAHLWRILRDANCDLLEVREDASTANPSGISNTILARKR